MDWEVRLDGDAGVLKALAASFQRQEVAVAESERGYVLRGSHFADLTDASAVRQAAAEIAQALSGLSRLRLGATRSLTVGAVIRLRNDGPADTFIGMKPAVLRAQVPPIAIQLTHADGTSETHRPADVIPGFLGTALDHSSVAKALRLWDRDELSWTNLYRIFEIIEADAGTQITSEWSTKKEVERFTRSANSVSAAGDASRHGRERTEAPPNPMMLSDARSLLQRLLMNWLDSRSRESGT